MIVDRCDADQLQEPDARSPARSTLRAGASSAVERGDHDFEVEVLAAAGVDDRHRPGTRAGSGRRPRPSYGPRRGSGRPPPAGAGWPRGRPSDEPARVEGLEPLEQQGEEDPALVRGRGRGSRRRSRAKAIPARVERARLVSIRCSDSGVVIRMSAGFGGAWLLAIGLRRRVARPDGQGQPGGNGVPGGPRLEPRIPSSGSLEVPGDVVVERLQRREVEDADALGLASGIPPEVVEAGQERGEGLARARRREQQGVLRPEAIAGQPSRCGGVGSPKLARNQPATAGSSTCEAIIGSLEATPSRARPGASSGWRPISRRTIVGLSKATTGRASRISRSDRRAIRAGRAEFAVDQLAEQVAHALVAVPGEFQLSSAARFAGRSKPNLDDIDRARSWPWAIRLRAVLAAIMFGQFRSDFIGKLTVLRRNDWQRVTCVVQFGGPISGAPIHGGSRSPRTIRTPTTRAPRRRTGSSHSGLVGRLEFLDRPSVPRGTITARPAAGVGRLVHRGGEGLGRSRGRGAWRAERAPLVVGERGGGRRRRAPAAGAGTPAAASASDAEDRPDDRRVGPAGEVGPQLARRS